MASRFSIAIQIQTSLETELAVALMYFCAKVVEKLATLAIFNRNTIFSHYYTLVSPQEENLRLKAKCA